MKKMLTKMLAVAMAWAMLLSCTVMASATSSSGIGGEGTLAANHGWGAGADLQVKSSGSRNYASGHATGISHNEGRVPSDVVRLVLPTVGKNAIDMILDPHNLIAQTKGARYGSSAAKMTFAEGTQVYFLNSSGKKGTDDYYIYSNQSQNLTITNKSSVPVSVNLTLRANKGSGSDGDKFKFAPSSGNFKGTDSSARMYLALVCDGKEVPVSETNSSGLKDSGMHTWAFETANFLSLVTSNGKALSGWINSTGTNSHGVFQWLTSDAKVRNAFFGSVGDTVEDSSDDNLKEISVELSVITGSGGNGGDEPHEYVTWADSYPNGNGIAVNNAGKILMIHANAPDGYNAVIQPDYLTQFSTLKSTGFVLNTWRETPVTVVYYPVNGSASKPIAAMYFNIRGGMDLKELKGNEDPDNQVKERITVNSGGLLPVAAIATMTKSIDEAQNAYVTAYSSSSGYYKAFREEDKVGWSMFAPSTIGDAKYDKLSFSLKGAIGGYESKWDTIGGDIGLELIWDVYAAPQLEGNKITFTVTKKAANKQALTLTWTAGTGDYVGYAPKTDTSGKATLVVNGQNIPMTVNTTAKTLTDPTQNNAKIPSGATGSVVFSKTGSPDITIKITDALK